MKTPRLVVAAVVALILSGAAQSSPDTGDAESSTISASQLSSDLDHWLDWMKNTHPDLSFSVDVATLDDRVDSIKSDLHGEMTRSQAWQAVARLNPLLADGHLGIRYPVDQYQSYLEAGGKPFPLNVIVTSTNELRTGTDLPDIPANTPITRINGHSTAQIVDEMLARARGDSAVLRRELIARRFPAFYWSLMGGSERYELELGLPDRRRTLTLTDRPSSPADDSAPGHFQYSVLKHQVGYLYIDTFSKEFESDFGAFLEKTFARIQQQSIRDLIIDLRDNGGGAHDLSDMLVNYLTSERVSPISGVKARVTPENQKLLQGAELGSVVATPYRRWYQPDADWPLRFQGTIYVVIGSFSYSQSIAFATEVQDFGIGKLVGEPTAGRANQTAQVQQIELPHSGLKALAPIYVMVRASGDLSPGGVQPDLFIENDQTNANATIETLLEHILDDRLARPAR